MKAPTLVRSTAAVRCAEAVLCLALPAQVARVAGGVPDGRAVWFARALGVRELVQAAVTAAAPTRAVVGAGAVVDTVHALSVLGLAAVDARRRRPALVAALAAGGWALLGLTLLRAR